MRDNATKVQTANILPPSGATGSIIIHGSDVAAVSLANTLTYEIHSNTEIWISVRPVQVTNHSYSSSYIGLYLLDNDYAESADREIRDSVEIVPSNEYIASQCESFDGSLFLVNGRRFEVRGVVFDVNDEGTEVFHAGVYDVEHEVMTLEYQGICYLYPREVVKWHEESAERFKLVRENKSNEDPPAFRCNYIQDLAVVPVEEVANRSASEQFWAKQIARLFENTPESVRN